jgi:hypothetical protein
MIGPPRAAETVLAQRLTGVPPMLGFEAALETSKIFSVSGLLEDRQPRSAGTDRTASCPRGDSILNPGSDNVLNIHVLLRKPLALAYEYGAAKTQNRKRK